MQETKQIKYLKRDKNQDIEITTGKMRELKIKEIQGKKRKEMEGELIIK